MKNNKKTTIKSIIILSILLCFIVVLIFNIGLQKATKEAYDNSLTETQTTFETTKGSSLSLEESELEEEIDNFADTKLANEKVVTVEKVDKQMIVTAKQLNIRSEADSTVDNIIGILSKGDIVTVIGICDNGWIEIEYNGNSAFTYEEYVEDIEDSDIIKD